MNQIFLGDCLQIFDQLEDNSVDMVFCDLPYGTTQNRWDEVIPYDQLWQAYERIVKPNGAILLMAQPPFDKVLACSNLRDFRYEWIWEKNKATGHLNARRMPMKAHEMILVFYKRLPTYHPQMTHGHKPMNAVSPRTDIPEPDEKRNYNHVRQHAGNPGGGTSRYPRDVIQMPVMNNDDPDKVHPTQKPIELVRYFIRTYSNEGAVVLDNAMGVGTTCIAAALEGRQYIGIESDQQYFDIAAEKISQITDK